MTNTMQGTFIGDLPKSDKPWAMVEFDGKLYFVNPDYPPRVLVYNSQHLPVIAVIALTND